MTESGGNPFFFDTIDDIETEIRTEKKKPAVIVTSVS